MSAPARAAGGQEQTAKAGQSACVVAETRRPRRARERNRHRPARIAREVFGAAAQSLRVLNLAGNVLRDAGNLRGLRNAHELDLRRNRISEIRDDSMPRSLRRCFLSGNPPRRATRSRAGEPEAPRGARAGRRALADGIRLSRGVSRRRRGGRAGAPDAGRRGRHRRRAARRWLFCFFFFFFPRAVIELGRDETGAASNDDEKARVSPTRPPPTLETLARDGSGSRTPASASTTIRVPTPPEATSLAPLETYRLGVPRAGDSRRFETPLGVAFDAATRSRPCAGASRRRRRCARPRARRARAARGVCRGGLFRRRIIRLRGGSNPGRKLAPLGAPAAMGARRVSPRHSAGVRGPRDGHARARGRRRAGRLARGSGGSGAFPENRLRNKKVSETRARPGEPAGRLVARSAERVFPVVRHTQVPDSAVRGRRRRDPGGARAPRRRSRGWRTRWRAARVANKKASGTRRPRRRRLSAAADGTPAYVDGVVAHASEIAEKLRALDACWDDIVRSYVAEGLGEEG